MSLCAGDAPQYVVGTADTLPLPNDVRHCVLALPSRGIVRACMHACVCTHDPQRRPGAAAQAEHQF